MKPAVRIATVLLDLDGVVRHFDPNHVHVVEQHHELPHGSLARAAFEPTILHLVTTGRISRAEWVDRVGQAVRSAAAARDWLSATGWIDTAMLAEIDRLRGAGLTVALLTNGTDTTAAELTELGIEGAFDAVFNSATIRRGQARPAGLRTRLW